MQVMSEDKHKLFAADYQKELERQIYLAKLRGKSGLLDILINTSMESNDTDDDNDNNNKSFASSREARE